jgi:hypothetical protein
MGQYYKIIFLADTKHGKEIIRMWIDPWCYQLGSKLMEHSYIRNGNPLMDQVEFLLSPEGMFYKGRIVWAGDYADPEVDSESSQNLYQLTVENGTLQVPRFKISNTYRYIVNHTKKQYVDKNKIKDITDAIHPLALLVSEGNQRGGGDYFGTNEELCGTWARDVISMENSIVDTYTELECNFME